MDAVSIHAFEKGYANRHTIADAKRGLIKRVVARPFSTPGRAKSRPDRLKCLTCCFSGAGDGNRTRVISLEG